MLEVDDINTFRASAHILQGLSLSVKEDEVVCLVGRNGAGKTTTIESIMGLLPVKSGSIRFHEKEIAGMPPHERARRGMGYAPEDSGIFPDLTVSENLMISEMLASEAAKGSKSSAVAKTEKRINAVFPEIRKLRDRSGLNLSGGQKKMVAIARAMALSPSLLLLDEAFEGLAPVVVSRFRDAVTMIKEMGISILIAESNLATASAIADRLYAIDRGEIIFHGTPKQALKNRKVMQTLGG
jgi:branched-chain amino acid transport system ATP-binding protein